MKKSRENHLKCAVNESTLSTAGAVPLPHAGKATIREYRFPHNVRANTRICGKRITTDKAFPHGEDGEQSEPDRVLVG